MLETSSLINIILLVIILFSISTWIVLTTRNMKFQKRIENYNIVNNQDKDISLCGSLEKKFNNLRKDIIKIIKKFHIDKSYKKIYKNDSEEHMILLADRIIFSLLMILFYLVLSLISFSKINIMILILSMIIGILIPSIIIKIDDIYRKKRIENDLLKAISLMNNAFKSGKSIIQAIEVVKEELDGPLSNEFSKIENDLLHGLSLNDAFERFEKRVNLKELDYITTSLLILNQTGGNIASVFKSIENSFYTRKKLDSELKSIVASSKLVFQMLVILPIFLWGIIGLWIPTYFTIFFESTIGILLFIVIISIYILYVVIIKNIMKVEKY